MLWHAPLHPSAGSGYVGERFFLSLAPSPALGRLGGGTGESLSCSLGLSGLICRRRE